MSTEENKDILELIGGKGKLLQVDMQKPVRELNVRELIELLRSLQSSASTVCADFSGFPFGTTFPPGISLTVNGIQFDLHYGGGGRIAESPSYPGVKLLEMVMDGSVLINLPVATKQIDLHVMQAGPEPIAIEYYASGGAVFSTFTTQYNVIEHIRLTGQDLTTVKMANPELLIQKVCYWV